MNEEKVAEGDDGLDKTQNRKVLKLHRLPNYRGRAESHFSMDSYETPKYDVYWKSKLDANANNTSSNANGSPAKIPNSMEHPASIKKVDLSDALKKIKLQQHNTTKSTIKVKIGNTSETEEDLQHTFTNFIDKSMNLPTLKTVYQEISTISEANERVREDKLNADIEQSTPKIENRE